MKVKFLGTAASEGWPALFCQCKSCRQAKELGGKNIRGRSSCIIEDKYMIDFPPDTFMHMLNNKLELATIHHVFITHSHEDHFYPQDLYTRQWPYAHIDPQYAEAMKVYGNSTVINELEKLGGEQKSNGTLKMRELRPFQSFSIGKDKFYTLSADHKPDEECLLYIIEINGKSLLYGHDSGFYPEETWKELRKHKLDVVIFDCTFGFADVQSGHMGVPAAIRVKERMTREGIINENCNFVLTHFSHNGGVLHEEMVERVSPHNFIIAFDGMELKV